MYPYQHCTILAVVCTISTELFGFTFWVTSVKLINQHNDISNDVIYFLDKADAINLQTGNKLSW